MDREEIITPSLPLDMEAIARYLEECEGEIEERIKELEESQFISNETLQLRFS